MSLAKDRFREKRERQFSTFKEGKLKELVGDNEPPEVLLNLMFLAFLEGCLAANKEQLPWIAILGASVGLNLGFAIGYAFKIMGGV